MNQYKKGYDKLHDYHNTDRHHMHPNSINNPQHKEHHTEHIHHGHSKHHEKTLSKSFYSKIYIAVGIVLIVFVLYNSFQISSFSSLFDQRLIEAKEAARPAKVELTVITTKDCKDCYDIGAVVDVVESTGVNITDKKEIDFSSEESKSLIDKYGIEKTPTLIVTGELDKARSLTSKFRSIGEEKQGAYIFTKLEPPFVDASTGDIRGKVTLVQLKKIGCDDCFDLTPLIEQLSVSGLIFEEQEGVSADSTKGKILIDRYSIEKVPTIIMDKEAEVYTNIVEGWEQFGTIEKDGSYIMRVLNPPYYSLEEKKVKGLVSLTILEDGSCKDCYAAAEFHKPVLIGMGVVLKEEKNVDISSSEGKALIEKYEIEKVPTIILEGDVEEYPALVEAWSSVGTVNDDGTYIFKRVEIAGKTYMDLSKGKSVDPQAAS